MRIRGGGRRRAAPSPYRPHEGRGTLVPTCRRPHGTGGGHGARVRTERAGRSWDA
ncbi:formate dehydrogenase accessory protein [Streptomyces sp. SPB78]|nr:formate dehydrogenase accessory protein [Streptomyces sp. SPB78]